MCSKYFTLCQFTLHRSLLELLVDKPNTDEHAIKKP